MNKLGHLRLASHNQTVMWKKSVFVFLFSLSALKAELGSETMKKANEIVEGGAREGNFNPRGTHQLVTSPESPTSTRNRACHQEFPSPTLDSKTNVVTKGQNVSLICSNQNKSLQISYSLFLHDKFMKMQHSKGEPVIFNLSISEAHNLGPYQCKAEVSRCSKYSHKFNFTLADPVITPMLNVTVIKNQTNSYVTLRCISFKGSLPINYTFFEKDIALSPAISKHVREPAELNVTKKNTGAGGEYRCKAENRLPSLAKYSHPIAMPSTDGDRCALCLQLLLPVLLLVLFVIILLASWILCRYKARKAVRDEARRDYGNTSMEAGIYANVCENQADKESVPGLEARQCVSTAQDETTQSQEIHYATPVFQGVKPRDHEAYNDDKTVYVYSELNI